MSLLAILYSGNSQTITTNPIEANEYCAGSEVKVTYFTTGTFNSVNIFFVQLSDNGFNSFRQVWILPKGSISKRSMANKTIYIVETGELLELNDPGQSIIYLKLGASLNLKG